MRRLMDKAIITQFAASVTNLVITSVRLLVVVVLLISPFRGAAMEPAR
jgi:hypothetical protein